ncbi:isopeptide-forming domain-containing fimbrial protein [Bifidobacterium aemilianum]|nr:isopeptide-forming domain-containing fimbrial protein [Bifidobacterium aemilianum]
MAAGGAITASAANRPAVSVAITGDAAKGRTYKAVKLADYTDVDESSTPFAVSVATVADPTIQTAAKSTLDAVLAPTVTNDDPMAYVAEHMSGDTSKDPEAYAGQLRDFVTALSKNADIKTQVTNSTISSVPDVNTQTPKFTFDDGIYLIEDAAPAASDAQTTLPILVSTKIGGVADANQPPFVTDEVKIKANYPGKPEKTTSQPSYNVGDLVDFTIKSTVPTYTNYDPATYVLHVNDKLSKGLSYSESLMDPKVSIDGTDLVLGTDYTIATTATQDPTAGPVSMTFNFDNFMRGKITSKDFSLAGKQIVITYKAILNDEAISVIYPNGSTTPTGSVHNDANVEFSNDPSDGNGGNTGKTPEGSTPVYTFKLQVNAVDKITSRPLEGAKFTVKSLNGAQLSFVEIKDNSGAVIAYRTPLPAELSDPSVTKVSEIVSPANGEMHIDGLREGTFTVKETGAPTKDIDGNPTSKYKLLSTEDFDGKIAATYKADKTLDTLDYSMARQDLPGLATLIDAQNGIFQVAHVTSLAQLPLTGAYGVTFLVSLGAILVLAGGSLYLVARKKGQLSAADAPASL